MHFDSKPVEILQQRRLRAAGRRCRAAAAPGRTFAGTAAWPRLVKTGLQVANTASPEERDLTRERESEGGVEGSSSRLRDDQVG